MKNKIFSPYLTRRKKPTWTKHDYLKVYSETSKSSYTVMLHLFCLIALSSRGELTKEPLIDIITTLLLCVFSFDNLLLEGGVLWLWMMLLSNFLFFVIVDCQRGRFAKRFVTWTRSGVSQLLRRRRQRLYCLGEL